MIRADTFGFTDVRFLSHCPSSLAAAAIICATDEIKDLAFVDPRIAASWCIGLTEVRKKLNCLVGSAT